MQSRAPPAVGEHPDGVFDHHAMGLPFMVQLRHLDEQNVKFIWWYLAQVDESRQKEEGEEQFEAETVEFNEAPSKLTYQLDRDVLAEAVRIFRNTFD